MSLLLQATENAAGIANQVQNMGEAETKVVSIVSLLLKGGWLMIPLTVISIFAIYIFVERLLALKKAAIIDQDFMNNIKDQVFDGKIDGANNLCRNHESPIARIFEKGIGKYGKSHTEVNDAMEISAKLELYKLEENLSWLATVAGAAPMIGFLGTVLGMIRAFFKMANAGNNVDPSLLAGGIYEALVTTAVGLLIGISAFIAYNYLVRMVDKVIFSIESSSAELVDCMPEKSTVI